MNGVVKERSGVARFLRCLKGNLGVKIGFVGGSITEMKGYTALLEADLRSAYPACPMEFVNAGISSTCSDCGAFRIEEDLLAKGKEKYDLVFLEFAVNDNQDGHLRAGESVRAMEGMVRRVWNASRETEIVFLYTANESHNASYAAGKIPKEIRAHERVAAHYGIASVNFAFEVGTRLAAKEFQFEKDFGGVHPALFGNRIYLEAVKELFRLSEQRTPGKPKKLPPLLDTASLVRGRHISPGEALYDGKWTFGVPEWDSIPGIKRDRYIACPALFSEIPGAEFSLELSGDAVGIFLTSGPDAGILEYSIDGGAFRKKELYCAYSASLHYPNVKMFAWGMKHGNHTLRARISGSKNPSSAGHAARIFFFCVN